MNEKENTIRLLADKTPLITSIWCFFGFHNYEQWSKPYQPNKHRIVFVQSRQCSHCNKVVVRRLRLPADI